VYSVPCPSNSTLSVVTFISRHQAHDTSVVGWGWFTSVDKWGTVYYISRQQEAGELLEFVYLGLFERTRKGVLTEAEMKAVEDELLSNPKAGAVIINTGGVRKVRAAQEGRGKSGSARVVYLYVPEQATVYFVLAFPKNVQGNLTAEQKRVVRTLVGDIKRDEWPRRRGAARAWVN
jgi:hypothetical protein